MGRSTSSARDRSARSWRRSSSRSTASACPSLRAARRVHADADGVRSPSILIADSIESYKADHARRAERRGDLRPGRARDAAGLPAHARPGPAGAARGVDARVRPAEHHRAVAQRADRRPRHRDRRAGRGRGHAGRRARARWSPATSSSTAPARAPSCAICSSRAATRRPLAGTRPAVRLEYALVVTFLYDQHYACNEYCKYYKNVENAGYKFIPAVHRTFYDGAISHVTGIVGISEDEFDAMPPTFDGDWLREHFPGVAESMDRFIDKVKAETHGELVGRPRDHAHPARRLPRPERDQPAVASSGSADHPLATTPVFLLGDSAIGSPYFQSISLGLECAFFLAGHHRQPGAADRRRSSSATRRSCTGSGCGSTCGPR